MRLFQLEVKRIMKSHHTLILLAVALLMSVVMVYLPVSFEDINRPNEDGTVTELNGLAAIEYKRDLYAAAQGEVIPEKVKAALVTYQNCVNQYGPIDGEGFPLKVNIEKILPIRPLLIPVHMLLCSHRSVSVQALICSNTKQSDCLSSAAVITVPSNKLLVELFFKHPLLIEVKRIVVQVIDVRIVRHQSRLKVFLLVIPRVPPRLVDTQTVFDTLRNAASASS